MSNISKLVFYGKSIGQMTKQEQELLHIDTLLITSLRMKDNGQIVKVGPMDLGNEMTTTILSKMRWEKANELLGLDKDCDCNQETISILENSEYSWTKFIRDYMRMGNAIFKFIEKELGQDELKSICLN